MGVGHFKLKFQVEGDIAHHSLLVPEKQNDYSFIWYQNMGSKFYRFITKHVCDGRTDGRTDGQTHRRTELRFPRPR